MSGTDAQAVRLPGGPARFLRKADIPPLRTSASPPWLLILRSTPRRGELGLLRTGRLLQPGPELLGGPQRGGGPHQELPVSAASGPAWDLGPPRPVLGGSRPSPVT